MWGPALISAVRVAVTDTQLSLLPWGHPQPVSRKCGPAKAWPLSLFYRPVCCEIFVLCKDVFAMIGVRESSMSNS